MRHLLLVVPLLALALLVGACGGQDSGDGAGPVHGSTAASPSRPSTPSPTPSASSGIPAPTSQSPTGTPATATSSVPTRAPSLTPTPLANHTTDLSARQLPVVVSPSRHIACMFDGSAHPSVRCDVDGADWGVATPKNCPGAYGDSVDLVNRRAHLLCHTDTVFDPNIPDAVAYGDSVTFHGLTCTSRRTGMTCSDGNGNGFTVSRESYRLF